MGNGEYCTLLAFDIDEPWKFLWGETFAHARDKLYPLPSSLFTFERGLPTSFLTANWYAIDYRLGEVAESVFHNKVVFVEIYFHHRWKNWLSASLSSDNVGRWKIYLWNAEHTCCFRLPISFSLSQPQLFYACALYPDFSQRHLEKWGVVRITYTYNIPTIGLFW
jgi:hypothetical protein